MIGPRKVQKIGFFPCSCLNFFSHRGLRITAKLQVMNRGGPGRFEVLTRIVLVVFKFCVTSKILFQTL